MTAKTYQPTDLLPVPPRDAVRDSRTSLAHMWAFLHMEGRHATAEYLGAHLMPPDPGYARTSAESSMVSGEIF